MSFGLGFYHGGEEVEFEGDRYVIQRLTEDYHVLAKGLTNGLQRKIPIFEIRPIFEDRENDAVDITEPSNDDWEEARRRLALIEPLLERRVPREQALQIAATGGVDVSTLYRWVRKFKEERKLSALLPYHPNGGRGKGRLSEETEAQTWAFIKQFYFARPQPTIEETVERVRREFEYASKTPPSRNAIRWRIRRISERESMRRRGRAAESAQRFDPKPGRYTEASTPLSVVQIDHTTLDIQLVDQESRLVIGRPAITIMIDVFSRVILGYYIALEPPGGLSIAQCIYHALLPKDAWLKRLGIKEAWPCYGIPAKLHSDNGKDFRAEALRRACEQHRIGHDFRRLRKPRDGAHIERLMGTLGQEIHKLPGTTFSNVKKKGEYDSEGDAVLTLYDLDFIISTWITGTYHVKDHSGIGMPPVKKWELGLFGDGKSPGIGAPIVPDDRDGQLRLDFMPHKDSTIQDYGVTWEGIRYYSDVLSPYIGLDHGKKYVFKRDPRDISRIYFLDPNTHRYAEIPYSNSTFPPISVWELRAIREKLRKDGRAMVDEKAIFDTHERIRERVEQARALTKKVRREHERKRIYNSQPKMASTAPAKSSVPVKVQESWADLEPFDTVDL